MPYIELDIKFAIEQFAPKPFVAVDAPSNH